MGATTITETELATAAAAIRHHHSEAERSRIDALDNACRCGLTLLEVKARIRRGTWMRWLKRDCGINDRTARLYMQLARGRSVTVATTIREARAALTRAKKPRATCPDTSRTGGTASVLAAAAFGQHADDSPFDPDGDRIVLYFKTRPEYEDFKWRCERLKNQFGITDLTETLIRVVTDADASIRQAIDAEFESEQRALPAASSVA